jgi:hypothetical protein
MRYSPDQPEREKKAGVGNQPLELRDDMKNLEESFRKLKMEL